MDGSWGIAGSSSFPYAPSPYLLPTSALLIHRIKPSLSSPHTDFRLFRQPKVEIPLPLRYRYHSVFACPVSKEQSTASNPPMLLPCGHVIARESLGRLARGTPYVFRSFPTPSRFHSLLPSPITIDVSSRTCCVCKDELDNEFVLITLSFSRRTLKCPYCPVVSHFSACVRVHF